MNEHIFDPNNTDHLQERIAALVAHSAGKPVEYFRQLSGQWVTVDHPQFVPDARYRPAPAPVWSLDALPGFRKLWPWEKWCHIHSGPETLPEGYRPLLVGEKVEQDDEGQAPGNTFSKFSSTIWGCVSDQLFYTARTRRPLPEYHNPDNLTAEQIGEEYRLLTVEEKDRLVREYGSTIGKLEPHLEQYIRNDWMACTGISKRFFFTSYTYRVPINWTLPKAPEKPPFWDCAADVPPVCWIKTPLGNASLVIHVAEEGIGMATLNAPTLYTWKQLQECECQWSADRKTWQECRKGAQP